MKNDLSIPEELDFAYLLELMPPLHEIPQFAWLPELFSILGVDTFLLLCKYAGGETIQVPTIKQLTESIEALQLFYRHDIQHKEVNEPSSEEVVDLLNKIRQIYSEDV